MFFYSNVTLTLRDICAYTGGREIFLDDRYEVIDWGTQAHYRLVDENTVELGGDTWGTLKDLLDKEVTEMGFADNGKWAIYLEG